MKWQDAYDARPSKNSRGEDVFDIYRKDTDQMIWADIPPEGLDEFMVGMANISNKVASDEFDKIFETEEEETNDTQSDNTTKTT